MKRIEPIVSLGEEKKKSKILHTDLWQKEKNACISALF